MAIWLKRLSLAALVLVILAALIAPAFFVDWQRVEPELEPVTPSATFAPTPEPTARPAPTAAATASRAVVVIAQALNVRSCPAITCPAVAWLTSGVSVTVEDCTGAWADIGPGWVHSEYLSEVCR